MQKTTTKLLYRCSNSPPMNNGLKDSCGFEMMFEPGSHHCPLCGGFLDQLPNEPATNKNEGTTIKKDYIKNK